MQMRSRPNILITGTPGTGKSTLAQKVAENLQLDYIDIGKAIKEREFFTDYDVQYDTHILDEDKLLDWLEERLNSDQGGVIIDYLSSDFFPKRWFDHVFVLRCQTEALYDRLTARGYPERKRRENLECEIFGTVAEEAQNSYDEGTVHELDNSTEEEMARNVANIAQIVGDIHGGKPTKRR